VDILITALERFQKLTLRKLCKGRVSPIPRIRRLVGPSHPSLDSSRIQQFAFVIAPWKSAGLSAPWHFQDRTTEMARGKPKKKKHETASSEIKIGNPVLAPGQI
jgi:hypothetical protein